MAKGKGSSGASKSSGSSGKARSAKTGQYVTKEYAEKHPSTTVVEKASKKK